MTKRLKVVFQDIAGIYEFKIDTLDVRDNHVHLFLGVSSRYSPARVVQIMKSISAKIVFEEFPEIRKHLWDGVFWSDGYFVRSVDEKVTLESIKRYIYY